MRRPWIPIYIGISLAGCAGPPPAPECARYVACQRQYDAAADTGPTDVSRYETDGACWQDDDRAAVCAAECQAGLSALADAARAEGMDAPACLE